MLPHFDLLGVSTALLLVSTFGVVVRRGFLDWLGAYRYQAVALSLVTAIIGYYTGIWEIYLAAALTVVFKAVLIPTLLTDATRKVKLEVKTETNPYVSLRVSVLASAAIVAMSYLLVGRMEIDGSPMLEAYLPAAVSLFLMGLFVIVSRRVALNQVLGLLITENGLFLFTTALTPGASLVMEMGIFLDILVGVAISATLLIRMGLTFDTLDVGTLEHLREE